MRRLLLTVLFLSLPALLSAQVTMNPTKVEFAPSADHNASFAGTPLVTKYELVIAKQSDLSVVSTTDLGKPTPVAGIISAPLPSLPNNVVLVATVRTVGPGGATPTPASNFFGVVGPPAAPGTPVVKP